MPTAAEHDKMLPGRLLSGFLAGLFFNATALAMSKKPINSRPLQYLGYATFTTVLGYGIHRYENHRYAYAEVARDKLTKRRMMRLEAAAGAE